MSLYSSIEETKDLNNKKFNDVKEQVKKKIFSFFFSKKIFKFLKLNSLDSRNSKNS